MKVEAFRSRMVSGVSWSAMSQVVTQVVAFATTAVLARLLLPAQFGIVGMAALYSGLVQMLAEVGLGAAVIQRRDLGDGDLDTVFWAGVVVGTAACGVSILVAPLAGRFFHNPDVVPLLRVSSFAFVVSALGAVHRVHLNRELTFDRLALVDIGSTFAYTITAVALALGGFGVWALILGQLVRAAADVVLLWRAEPWRPRLHFDRSAFKSLIGFGGNVWGFNLLNYLRENIDFLSVGRVLGASQLGYYTMAYNLANLPRRQLSNVVSRVAFPAFSRVQDDNELLRAAYTKVIRYVTLIAFPCLAGLALVAPEFVRFAYGPNWHDAVVPLQLLCGAGMVYSIGTTQGSIFLAKGKADWMFRIGIVTFAALALMVLVGLQYGIVGVSSAVLTYAVTSLALGQGIVNRLVGLRIREFLRAGWPATVGCAAMAVALVGFRLLVPPGVAIGQFIWLVIAIPLGVVVYMLVLWAMRVPETGEVIKIVRASAGSRWSRWRNRKSATDSYWTGAADHETKAAEL